MSYIKIIYKDEEVNYNGSLQGAIESAFKYEPDKCGYIEVLDGNITENIQLYHGVNLYFANGVTFKGTMTDGGKSLTAIISGNGTLTTFGTGNVFNIQNANSHVVVNCNVINGATSSMNTNLKLVSNIGLGSQNSSTDNQNFIYGQNNSSTGNYNILGGINNSISGDYNAQFGQTNILYIDPYLFNKFGRNNIQSGNTCILFGSNNIQVSDVSSLSGGANAQFGKINRVDGYYNLQSGSNNILIGSNNIHSGASCTLSGNFNLLSGYGSEINGGNFNLLSGNGSEIKGHYNTQSGNENRIVGNGNNQSGSSCSITGHYNIQGGGTNKISTGNYNIITGTASTATNSNSNLIVGNENIINNSYENIIGGRANNVRNVLYGGIVGGLNNSITGTASFVSGQYNVLNASYAFTFGNSITSNASSAYLFGNNFTNTKSNTLQVNFGSTTPQLSVDSQGITASSTNSAPLTLMYSEASVTGSDLQEGDMWFRGSNYMRNLGNSIPIVISYSNISWAITNGSYSQSITSTSDTLITDASTSGSQLLPGTVTASTRWIHNSVATLHNNGGGSTCTYLAKCNGYKFTEYAQAGDFDATRTLSLKWSGTGFLASNGGAYTDPLEAIPISSTGYDIKLYAKQTGASNFLVNYPTYQLFTTS